jgi:hypothetical protein
MEEELLIKLGVSEVVHDERDYVNVMASELNISYDVSLTKTKIFEKYKSIVFNKFGKPDKYPCLIYRFTNDDNKTVAEFIYKKDISDVITKYKGLIKNLDSYVQKLTPKKKKEDTSFL